jgi:hypothetical protein
VACERAERGSGGEQHEDRHRSRDELCPSSAPTHGRCGIARDGIGLPQRAKTRRRCRAESVLRLHGRGPRHVPERCISGGKESRIGIAHPAQSIAIRHPVEVP